MSQGLTVKFKDQIYARVEGERDILSECWDALSYVVPGAKFTPAYKSGRWDGSIRMLNLRDQTFFKNNLGHLMKWCKEAGYDFHMPNKELFRPRVKWDPTWLDRWAEYATMEPAKHQREIVHQAMTLNQALILSPTSSGKTFMTYLMIRYMLENTEGQILVTVPTGGLIEQMESDFKDYAGDLWDVEANFHMIYGGREKTTRKRLIVGTRSSIANMPTEWFENVESYICDEAHEADKKSITSIIDNLPHAPYRIGMTGTLNGTKIHMIELTGRFGPVINVISTRELMDIGFATDIRIIAKRLHYKQEEKEAVKAAKDYDSEVKYVNGHAGRNQMLVDDALRVPGNALVLFRFQEHGELVHKMFLEGAEAAGKIVYFIHGGIKVDERERMRKEMEHRDDVILLASYGTLSTGISIKNLMWVFFGHPYKSRIKNLQSIGRGIRKKEGKKFVVLVDYGDDFSYKPKTKLWQNHLLGHFIRRLELYTDEEFEYEVIDVNM